MRYLWPYIAIIQLTIPVFLLAHHLPYRAKAPARLTVTAICLILVALLLGLTSVNIPNNLAQFFTFSLILVGLILAIMFIYDVALWPALFCGTAGYAMQNLESGLDTLMRMLISGDIGGDIGEPLHTIIVIGMTVLVYMSCYLLFIRKINRIGTLVIENHTMLLVFVAIVFAVIGFDVTIKEIIDTGSIAFIHAVLLRLIHAFVCVFVLFAEYQILFAQRLRAEKAATERLLAERERQYKMSRENIEAINIKCHDIRHQVRTLAAGRTAVDQDALDDLAEEVNVYDSAVHTGNDALDTILTEKSLLCERESITLSCIADGAALDFMRPADLYALFGNILDNAIEGVSALDDPERRSISLQVKRRGSMVMVHEENYYPGGATFKDGLPVTTKADKTSHGFGTKSMRHIAEKYDGSLVMSDGDNTFCVDAMLPMGE